MKPETANRGDEKICGTCRGIIAGLFRKISGDLEVADAPGGAVEMRHISIPICWECAEQVGAGTHKVFFELDDDGKYRVKLLEENKGC